MLLLTFPWPRELALVHAFLPLSKGKERPGRGPGGDPQLSEELSQGRGRVLIRRKKKKKKKNESKTKNNRHVCFARHGVPRVLPASKRAADGASWREEEHLEKVDLCLVWKHVCEPPRGGLVTLVARRRGAALQLH